MLRVSSSDSLAAAGAGRGSIARPPAPPRRTTQLRLGLRGRRWAQISIPTELWGAAALTLRLCAARNGATTLFRAASTVAHASAAAISSPLPDYPASIADALDFKPRLQLWEDLACLTAAVAAAVCVYTFTAPAAFSPAYAAAMALLAAGVLSLARAWVLERHYKAIQRSERDLASSDSLFLNVDGVSLHYKAAVGTRDGTLKTAIHCLHGFGASSFSWAGFCLKELAAACAGVATAHDMPGFGLSQRPSSRRPYSMAFNGAAAGSILDAELEKHGMQGAAAGAAEGKNGPKKVLIGHSMGGAAAAEGVIRSPEGVAGLVLVSPAIVALWMGVPPAARGDAVATGVALTEELILPEDPPGEIKTGNGGAAPHRPPRPLGRVAAAVVQAVTSEAVRLALVAITPLMILFLRRLVRSKAFWERGLSAAWVNKAGVTKSYVDGYRLGQLVRGWEMGIIRFTGARFSEKAGLWASIASALDGDGHLSQAERLAAACADGGVKVLIVHGSNDSLVPVANSRRLATLLPGATFVEFPSCGHMPHEECPDRFVEVVQRFVEDL